ncbi:hypothetical protein D3C77_516870 [compost metagenome]
MSRVSFGRSLFPTGLAKIICFSKPITGWWLTAVITVLTQLPFQFMHAFLEFNDLFSLRGNDGLELLILFDENTILLP